MSEIEKWYSGKNILITGATGFIGKVLLEKILRVVPNIGTIYLLIRPLKGKSSSERLNEILNKTLFNKLKLSSPKLFEKIKIFEATLTHSSVFNDKKNEIVAEIIEECNVIFHCAADVHFDKNLHDIFYTNVIGAENMVQFAQKLKKLNAFIYCSTTYCLHQGITLEERQYTPPIDPKIVLKLLEEYSQEIINPLNKKILGDSPNTYSFTKLLAEDLVGHYGRYYPLAIARPSVVVYSSREPIAGWSEGINGINGFTLACARGAINSLMGNDNEPINLIPVDIVSNALIILGWQLGTTRPTTVKYYNIAQSKEDVLTFSQLIKIIMKNNREIPLNYTLMRVGGSVKKIYLHHIICLLWYNYIPAIILDCLLVIFRQKPILIKIQRKLAYGVQFLAVYLTNKYEFETKNFDNLKYLVNEVDAEIFPTDAKEAIKDPYFYNSTKGFKVYVANENLEDLPKARRFQRYISILQYTIDGIALYFIGKFICPYAFSWITNISL